MDIGVKSVAMGFELVVFEDAGNVAAHFRRVPRLEPVAAIDRGNVQLAIARGEHDVRLQNPLHLTIGAAGKSRPKEVKQKSCQSLSTSALAVFAQVCSLAYTPCLDKSRHRRTVQA